MSTTFSPHQSPLATCNISQSTHSKQAKKVLIVIVVLNTVVNSTLSSAIPSGAVESISTYFNITSAAELVLPVSIYLLGYVFGPLVFGPLSEEYGRKIIMVPTFLLFIAGTLGCALAPNWPAFLIFRFLAGIGASCPIMIVGGIYADIFDDPVSRGRAMAVFMAGSVPANDASSCANFRTGKLFWSDPGSYHRRLYWCERVEVAVLGRPHLCRSVAASSFMASRDVPSHHLETTGIKSEEAGEC